MSPEPSAQPGRVAARLARHVEVGLSRVDLSLPQYRILMFLADGDAQASALADYLAVSRPSVTAVVDGLAGRGLVERQHDLHDRRRVGHTITPAGRLVLGEADTAVNDRLNEILEQGATPEDRVAAFGELAAWRRAIDGYRAVRQAEKLAGSGTPR